MIYIAILIYTLYLSYRYDLKGNQANYIIHYRILLTLTIAIVGFSYRLGMDTVGYMEHFDRVDSNLKYTFQNLSDLRYEPIPELLFSFCKGIWDDFTLVQIVIGIFVNVVVFWFLRKHSPMFFFSVFLYYIFQYWNMNFEIKRESIAICIFLIAIDRILKENVKLKDYLWYYGICCIALLAHKFAFITFIYPLLQNLKLTKRFILLYCFAFLFLALVPELVSKVIPMVNVLFAFSSGDIINSYLESSRFGAGGLTIFGTVHQIIVPLFILYSVRQCSNKTIYSLALLNFILLLLQSQIFIFYRLRNYLMIFLFIVYATALLESIKNKNYIVRGLIIFVALFQIFLLSGKEQHIRYLPYNSIFNKELIQEREATYRELDYMLNY